MRPIDRAPRSLDNHRILNFGRQVLLRLRVGGLGACVEVGAGVSLLGKVRVSGPGLVRIGPGVRLDGRLSGIQLVTGPGAELTLGEGVVINEGVSIEALRSVRIGARCRLGAFCKILDNDMHLVEGVRVAADHLQRAKLTPGSHPVTLEEEVTLGPRVIILPGAHLGRGTRVKAGAVFSHRTPAGAEVVGHPARVLSPT
jgi:acetyltransferase-like isoleucine patch superfamily enzyme